MSLSAQLFGRDSFIFKATNVLGLGIPGWLDKKFGPKGTEGPRLDDLSVQTSTYGADIPRLYGTISMAGNILWLEGGKLKEVVKKNKKGGKGGASTTPTKTYTYYATFALGLCEGPIAGIRRIWCADTLLYNAGSEDLETIIASNANAKGWKLYLGSDDQQPDARYEADVGVGNAPAFRGLAYLVFYDFELTDYANTLQASQFKVEIVCRGDKSISDQVSRLPASEQWSTVATSGDCTIALSAGSSSCAISRDGRTWSRGGLGRSSRWVSIKYQNSSFYALSSDGLTAVSSDGASWVFHNTIPGLSALKVYDGLFYSYRASDSSILSSGDAASWDLIATLPVDVVDFCKKDGVLIACPASGKELVSIDESGSIDLISLPYSSSWSAIDSDGSRILLLSSSPSYASLVSFDLAHWNNSGISSSKPFIGMTANESGIFCISAPSGGSCTLAFSSSADYWIYTDVAAENWFGICSNEETFRAVAPGELSLFAYVSSEPAEESLESVIRREFYSSKYLYAEDLIVDEFSVGVAGYKVASGTIRSALEPLQSAYPFDVVQSGYQVRIVSRGKSSVRSILLDDLYAGEDGRDDALSQSREMDSQLPSRIVVKYLDAGREYDVSQQQYQRASTASVEEMSLDLSLVLTADEAAGIAEILCYLAWLERIEFSFILPPHHSDLEPADVVTLYDESVSYELRITETTQGVEGRTECKAVPNRASLYTSQAKGGTGVIASGLVTLPGKSLAVLLDIPVVDETVQNDPGFVAAMTGYTTGWPGAVLIGSSDNGQTYTDLQGFAGKGTFGTTIGVLTANRGTLIDLSSIQVSLFSGQLESVTRDRMLSGVNYAAYGIDGRWEIVRFQNAVLQSDGTYLLSGFVRGQRGTEWATGLHKESDWFVLLDDPDNAFIDLPSSALAETRLYKAVTSRQSADDSSGQSFTYKGVNLQPLSPVYAKGSRNADSLTVTWTRRSRLSNSWWSAGVVAPLGEDSESYQTDVMSGSTVVRTIPSSSAAITYTAAEQQADFGSVQSSITLRIFQMSPAVGRGRALEVTL